MKIFFTAILILGLLYPDIVNGQHPDQIFITDDGIMHWSRDSSEVTGFGENYTVPFAYGYRAAKRMGVDLKGAIDQDVYQFARLGFDLFRVHVWDCEISDTLGNLLENEHLELFDYLLWKLKEKGINAVITPIAYWGNGWPEKDEPTPGFSTKYGKGNCLTNPDAIKAQEKYLFQFVNHVNRYTGIAYKNDPQILAFEICNEPHHRGPADAVTAFVRKMKDAIQSTGCTKPILYNVSHGINYAQDYFDAGIDGGTFQWYPTGLGFQKELGGNMLPTVDKYEIPFDDVLKKNHAARFVYEFDAADMATSYMYPAMARSFRTTGMQMATHFAWDPTYTAPYNTEYNTHFMNLFYAPQKALSLMICGEIFRTIPLYKDYGVYPDNTSFGPFHISYENNLAEMVTDEKFIYTNNTTSKPNAPEKLELIAGYGNSPLVQYDGTGAYFFDKLGDGIW
ncbi:MAG: cellulase family glycosylhydrolase, partial [Saprospiraceae bacterium]